MSQSHLVEPGVKYFLRESLKQCSEIKKQYNLYFYWCIFVYCYFVGTILWVNTRVK